ncbi:MAG: TIGR02757 family protein [Planctomycetota bacterium]
MNKRIPKIRNVLKKLYKRYNRRELISPDPLQFVYHYSEPADMEIAAFLASALAYGRVEQIEKSLDNLLGRLGDSPYEFVIGFDKKKRRALKDFKHRFTTGDDISDLLMLFRKIISRHGSLERYFARGYSPGDKNIIPALSEFCNSLLNIHAVGHKGQTSRGLKYLLVSPAGGSACKRLNLFLRWMVRDDDFDTGLWKSIDKAKLIVPVDVHMSRLCKILGLYDRKTVSLPAAIEITESFAEIEPADPVKYDFALSRIGILENCNGRLRKGCELCELFGFCSRR